MAHTGLYRCTVTVQYAVHQSRNLVMKQNVGVHEGQVSSTSILQYENWNTVVELQLEPGISN